MEDASIPKVWHNYGFDRHVIGSHGINVQGFGGDTMQMARLWDSSRMIKGGYSLEGLTRELDLGIPTHKHTIKHLFGYRKTTKEGTEGKVLFLPPLRELQENPKYVGPWIEYSAFDAESTWHLRNKIQVES